jgi:hypothetical protein
LGCASVAHDSYSVERSKLSNTCQEDLGARAIGLEFGKPIVHDWLACERTQQSASTKKVGAISAFEAYHLPAFPPVAGDVLPDHQRPVDVSSRPSG